MKRLEKLRGNLFSGFGGTISVVFDFLKIQIIIHYINVEKNNPLP